MLGHRNLRTTQHYSQDPRQENQPGYAAVEKQMATYPAKGCCPRKKIRLIAFSFRPRYLFIDLSGNDHKGNEVACFTATG
jgi:hypothetical protein